MTSLSTNLSLLMLGDFVLAGRYEKLAASRGKAVFGFLQSEISEADISFINVEAPLCREGAPIKKSGPVLRCAPEAAQVIADAEIDVVGLANNHVMDLGREGLVSTLSAFDAVGVATVGAGLRPQDAWMPYVCHVNGRTVALLAVAEREFNIDGSVGAAIVDEIDLTKALLKLTVQYDVVVVTIHGGNEYYGYPRPGLRRLCRFLIEMGAHAVICHHPHVRGAYESHCGRPIAYSLGNAIFDHPNPPPGWSEGFAAKLNIVWEAGEANVALDLIPYVQSVKDGGIRRLSASEIEALEGWRAATHTVMHSEEAYASEWRQFCRRRKNAVLSGLLAPVRVRGVGHLINAMRKIGAFRDPSRLNLLRCPSHREVLTSVLESS